MGAGFLVTDEGVVGDVAGSDSDLGAWGFEGLGQMSAKHLDADAVIDLFDVTDLDTLPKDGFTFAFNG